ncbi:tyrosine-type recombinase/integrase [Chloroflexota bacterium]
MVVPGVGLEPTRVASADFKYQSSGIDLGTDLLNAFLQSRRDGISPNTIEFYSTYLRRCATVLIPSVSIKALSEFIKTRKCSSGGKHAYYRVLRVYFNWLFSVKSGQHLNIGDNPIVHIDPPKVERKILPSLSIEQVENLLEQAETIQDKAIISLFVDSGLRLSELASIKVVNIDWNNRLIKARCKGNKEGLAPFGVRTEMFLKNWLAESDGTENLWNTNGEGIYEMLRKLRDKTGLPCNPHTFRRTFASLLAKRGVDSLHIMRLGRWESIQMVERYTRSVRFDDSLKLYRPIMD